MIRRPPRSTQSRSSAASDVYKRQLPSQPNGPHPPTRHAAHTTTFPQVTAPPPDLSGALDHPVIARCQLHKLRNVADKLPDHLAATVTKRMRAAYHARSAILAEAQLEALAKELDRTHPGAAGSLREGLSETLTVLRLGVSPTLTRTPRSTRTSPRRLSVPPVMMNP